MDAAEIGMVQWYESRNGYGFIRPDRGGPDVFVHASEVERAGLPAIREGQRVSFERVMNGLNGKPRATHLREVR